MKKLNLIFVAIFNCGLICAQTKDSTLKSEDEILRDIQLTLFTPIGTNGIESHKTINKISINIFAGTSRGVNGIEGAGFANLTIKDVNGIQMAGFSNVVLNNVKGLQLSGFSNYSGGNFFGVAGAGFCNVNLGTLLGSQGAGFCNFNRDSLYGGQFSGFCNVNLGKLKGAQFSGFCNYNQKQLIGVQGSGFLNTNIGNVKGAQFSGFANVAVGDLEGIQVSGFLNYAKNVKGSQFSFINIADSVDGAAVGFLSFVKKGLHQAEVSANELFYANVSLRTGTNRFYNIFSAGMSPQNNGLLWNIGYGIGTSFKVNETFRSDVNISMHHVSKGLFYQATSELYKVYWGMEYKLANKCYIAAGPTFNLYFGDALLPDYSKTYNKVAPYSLLNETNSSGFNFKAWVGANVAIRFL